MNQMAQSGEKLSDTQVIKQVLNGDKESYGLLVDRYAGLVYRLALNLLKDCDTAEDITQEAFMTAYQNLECLRNPAAFPPWVARIARNQCYHLQRKSEPTPVSLDYLAELGFEPAEENEAPVFDKEMALALRNIVAKLPPKYREIVDLRYVEGFSYQRLGDFLGISMSAVKSRLYHAKKEVVKLLKKEGWL